MLLLLQVCKNGEVIVTFGRIKTSPVTKNVFIFKIPGSCFEEDTVYKGEPLKEVNPIKDVESALDCQVQCQENPDCEYFTWNSGTGGGKWNKKNANTCWLKSTQGNIKMNCGKKCTGRTSGAKFC